MTIPMVLIWPLGFFALIGLGVAGLFIWMVVTAGRGMNRGL